MRDHLQRIQKSMTSPRRVAFKPTLKGLIGGSSSKVHAITVWQSEISLSDDVVLLKLLIISVLINLMGGQLKIHNNYGADTDVLCIYIYMWPRPQAHYQVFNVAATGREGLGTRTIDMAVKG